MAGKNKGGREVRKPKQVKKVAAAEPVNTLAKATAKKPRPA
jgi:hypothetical protein